MNFKLSGILPIYPAVRTNPDRTNPVSFNGRYQNLSPLQMDTVTFSGRENYQASREEFKSLKKELSKKCEMVDNIMPYEKMSSGYDFTDDASKIITGTTRKEQVKIKINLLDKILSDENLHNNPCVMRNVGGIVQAADTKKQNRIAGKILSNPELYNNLEFMKSAEKFIRSADTKKQAQIANKIVMRKTLYRNKNFMENYAVTMVNGIDNEKSAHLANEIITGRNLFENPDFMKAAITAFRGAEEKDNKEIKQCLIEKISSCEDLVKNETFIKNAEDFVRSVKNEEQLPLANKILADKKINTSKEIMDKAAFMFYSPFSSKEQAKVKCRLLDKITSSENLYNNKEFMEYAALIVYMTNTKEELQAKSKLIDKIGSDEKLYNDTEFMKDAGSLVCNARTEKCADSILQKL